MYFFYVDESGSRDCPVKGVRPDGTAFEKEHLYVLTAVSLFEYNWGRFEREICNLKLELRDNIYKTKHRDFDLADCEVKSTWLRHPRQRERESPFLHVLSEKNRKRISDIFYAQLGPNHMHVFSVVIDKRKLRSHMTHVLLHKKAYELLLERIQSYLTVYHRKHQGILVMDDTHKMINREVSMKHGFFQREGNQRSTFRNIVESPFFTDSKLSNGVQLADLCGYNVYRAFRYLDFKYPYFQALLPHFYHLKDKNPLKLEGLKVWPEDSDLVEFGRQGWIQYKTEQPTLWDGLLGNEVRLGEPYQADMQHPTRQSLLRRLGARNPKVGFFSCVLRLVFSYPAHRLLFKHLAYLSLCLTIKTPRRSTFSATLKVADT